MGSNLCRAGSVDTAELWDDIRSSWCIVCLPVTGCENKVKQEFCVFFFLLVCDCRNEFDLFLFVRMQADSSETTMKQEFIKTMRGEGVRGFYRGLLPNLLKVVPVASITYIVYEAMKKNMALD